MKSKKNIKNSFAFSFLFITSRSWFSIFSLFVLWSNLAIIFLWSLKSFICRVETIDGSANEGEDYIAVNEILTFEPYETEKEVLTTFGLNIIDMLTSRLGWRSWTTTSGSRTRSSSSSWQCSKAMEMERWNWVEPVSWRSPSWTMTVSLVDDQEVRVTLLNISDPGSFQFEKRGHLVKESCGEAVLSVIRFQTLH